MNSCFNKNFSKNFRRLFLLAAMMALLASVFTGCMKKENPEVTTDPSTQPPLLIEPEDETTLPPEATLPQAPEANIIVEGKMITITGAPVEVHNQAGPDGAVIGRLEVGTKAEVLRQVEFQDGAHWALVREGWICLDAVDVGGDNVDNPEDPDSLDIVPEANSTQEDPTRPPRPSEDKPDPNVPHNNNNNTNNNAKGDKGVVRASELNVRKEPSTEAEKTGVLKNGTRVNILEKRDGWGRVENGWISLNYVYMDGTTGVNTAKGIVTANGLNVRSGPGTNYGAVASYNSGTRVNILEQFNVGGHTWGCTKDGWIAMNYVYVDGTTGEGSGTGKVNTDALNIRSGPGTGFNSVGSLNTGDTGEILAQFEIGGHKWGCIKQGWIAMQYVDMN